MKFPLLLCGVVGSAAVPPARADYRDDTGFTQLSAELGAAMPNGTGVGLTHVEAKLPSPPFAADAYLPQAGSGTFPGSFRYAGKQFTAKSGAGAGSFHADEVAAHYYGNSTGLTTTYHSMCPGVVDVDCYSASDWTSSPAANFLAPTAARLEPIPEIRAVQCHAWIYEAANAGETTFVNDLVRRQDFSINRDSYLCSVGLSNVVTSNVPDLWAAGYNALAVGLSNGQHSRGPASLGGTTTSDMDGPGRRKPDLVAPLAATSYAAGYIGGAAGLLRQSANAIVATSPNARHVKTLKAVLLAGATKDEFPAWSRTATHPIDAIYGAGELNIHHSYFILNGGEQPPNNAAGRPHMGWDYHLLGPNGTADYRLNIPAGQYGVELSAFLVWHRTLTDSNALPAVFTLAPDPLVNFTLTLFRDPAAGGAAVTIDSSTSTLYNLEHVWQKNLPAGNYRLRVSRGSGSGHEFALAWRLHTAPHQPQPVMASAGNSYQFTFPDLIIGQPYKFQSSPNLTAWTDLETFTASTTSATRLLLKPANPRLLYRLLPILP